MLLAQGWIKGALIPKLKIDKNPDTLLSSSCKFKYEKYNNPMSNILQNYKKIGIVFLSIYKQYF